MHVSGECVAVYRASISLEQLEELLHIRLERGDGDYFTLAGLLLEQLQHVPVVGEEIALAGYQFQINSMEGRRILQVRAISLHDDPGITQIGY